jgi:hypothetical protein
LKQFLWYAFQTAIVAVVVYGYVDSGGQQVGLALALGIGWALCATISVHLTLSGLRRLAVLILPRRRENRDAIAIGEDRPLVPLELLGGVNGGEGDTRRDRPLRLRDSRSDHHV